MMALIIKMKVIQIAVVLYVNLALMDKGVKLTKIASIISVYLAPVLHQAVMMESEVLAKVTLIVVV